MLEVGQYQNDLEEPAGAGAPQITGATAREIAASAEGAIRDGTLDAGDPLPTVRALAKRLHKSPATVNAAYRILRQRGLATADGRRGTRVAPRPALRAPAAARRASGADRRAAGQPERRDLAAGLADPALLPAIGPAIARVKFDARLGASGSEASGFEAIDAGLLQAATRLFAADRIATGALTVVSGALDGVERVLQAHLRPGDRVVVEDPCYPPIRDILLILGLVAVPVAVDDRGLIPDALAAGLARNVEAVVSVPRAQNPLGAAVDAVRARELQDLLGRRPDLLLIEDDHASVVAGAPYASMIASSWSRWAVVRAMSKVLDPDLRLAIVAGDETTVARVEGRQALGPRWVSHILQATTAELLLDPAFEVVSARARAAYGARRQALIAALGDRGVAGHGESGLNVWVPVTEEAPVVRGLLDAGWLVTSGERFRFSTPPGIRVTTATLQEQEAPAVAEVIAAAEHAARPRRAY
jgi:DNA-binding transcriptional MocR family regulator